MTGPDARDPSGRDRNDAAYVGGADAVEKTTYVSDVHGAEVEEREQQAGLVAAEVPHDRGLGVMGWAAVLLAVLTFVAYAAGLFG
jgi:hypothetical protein